MEKFHVICTVILLTAITGSNCLHRSQSNTFGSDCKCSNINLCNRIDVPQRQEIVIYGVDLTNFMRFDWSKITTIVVYESALKKIGMDLVCQAHLHQARVLIAASISEKDIKNVTARTNALKHYLGLADQFYLDGANIDFETETKDPALRDALTAFARETKAVFKSAYPSSIVILDVFWVYNIYHNETALANAVDILFIMAYDEQPDMQEPCVARANSPFAQTQFGVASFLALGIPGDKLVLGQPWYGYFYKCNKLSKENLCFLDKVNDHCSQSVGREGDYKEIMDILPHSMGGRQWSDIYKSPFLNYETGSGDIMQVWYDDPESLKPKYNLANIWKLRGVGVWQASALNYSLPIRQDTKEMWDALPNFK